MTAIADTGSRAAGRPVRKDHISRVLRSEWTKLRTVRSTYWTLIVAVLLTIALGSVISYAHVARWAQLSPIERLTLDPTALSLRGVFLAQLAIGVLGVLAITAEYSTGMIRATLSAVPNRRMVLAAKAAVFAPVAFVAAAVGCFAAFGIGQAIFAEKQVGVSLSDPTVLRAVIGGALYLSVLGLLALGLGALIRHSAGAIATLFGLILVLPLLTLALPSPWNTDVGKYLPSSAGLALFQVHQDSSTLTPWVGFGVFCAWAAAALIPAFWLITRRDA